MTSDSPAGGGAITGGPAAGGSRDGVRLDGVVRAIADIAAGRPVVVVDDANRENEGDIIAAASMITPPR